jgi:hypothetical protein
MQTVLTCNMQSAWLLCTALSIKQDLDIINKSDTITNISCTKINENLSLQCITVTTPNFAMNEELGIPVSALNTVT